MLVIYRAQEPADAEGNVRLEPYVLGPNDTIPMDAVWIDMVEPTPKEDGKVEQHLGISIPTREDMSDIEPSELLYTENNVRYMTMRLFHNVENDLPEIAGVSFILRDNVLVTVRYVR
ncbi:MAG: magnesium transporter, partial [Beijerinckiaceae bacterium]|nr:magnesium transporter [Beijerinckiaceae bacterium]